MYIIDPADKPGRPEKVEVVGVQKREAKLKWTKPRDDGGSPITGYVIEHRVEGGFKWVVANEGEIVTDTSYKVTDLKDNTNYDFRVAATNKAGVGEYTETDRPVKVKEPIGEYNTIKLT